jgi:ABC-type methionine transport system ATPase subunit
MPDTITIESVWFYSRGFPVLRDISLTARRGETLAVTGRSGVGKSVLLELCAGIIQPSRGRVLWDGIDLGSCGRTELYRRREDMGFVFQVHALIANHTIFDNLALPLRYHSDMTETEIRGRVRAILDLCGVFNADRSFPESLSAGQLRAASLARAMVTEPSALLLDEPTSGIDPATEESIINVLKDYQKRRNALIIIVSDSITVTKQLASRTLIVDSGKLMDLESAAPAPGTDLHTFISHFR